MSAVAEPTVTEYCTFEVGPLLLGIDVTYVQEVLRAQEITPVPLAHPAVRGLINLRGQIVTAVDLRRRLGLEPSDEPPLNVVVHVGDRNVSLLVDAIGDVVATEVAADPPPRTASAVVLDACTGVLQLADRLLLVLDAARVTELPGRDGGR